MLQNLREKSKLYALSLETNPCREMVFCLKRVSQNTINHLSAYGEVDVKLEYRTPAPRSEEAYTGKFKAILADTNINDGDGDKVYMTQARQLLCIRSWGGSPENLSGMHFEHPCFSKDHPPCMRVLNYTDRTMLPFYFSSPQSFKNNCGVDIAYHGLLSADTGVRDKDSYKIEMSPEGVLFVRYRDLGDPATTLAIPRI